MRSNLPAFHALTGCDVVSGFYGIGKKKAWGVFQQHSDLLTSLGVSATDMEDNLDSYTINPSTTADAEKFVCKLYQPNCEDSQINKVRYRMFQQAKDKLLKHLPPTYDTLSEHIKRTHLQAIIWKESNFAQPSQPLPTQLGWTLDNNRLIPVLATKPAVPTNYLATVSCNCKDNV